MIDVKKIDLNQVPKKFCDGSVGAFGKELFTFGITSGAAVDMYATTPQIMKSISIWLNKQINDYEANFGEIDMTPPDVKSPIQFSDLK